MKKEGSIKKLTDEIIIDAIKNNSLYSSIECFEDEDVVEDATSDGDLELSGEAGKGHYTAWANIDIEKGSIAGTYKVNGSCMVHDMVSKDVDNLDDLRSELSSISEEIWDLCMSI